MRFAALLVVLLSAVLLGCQESSRSGLPSLATTTSYLEAAARDILGNDVNVVRLAEPGTCPGHFDIRPGQVQELRRCRALLRFDFQKALDEKLAGRGTQGPAVAEIALRSGMCVPGSYLAACRQVADHLIAQGLLSRADAEAKLQLIGARIEALAREATNQVARAGLAGTPVIASSHQRDFCEWLGLRVVASFRSADTASISEIERAIEAGTAGQARLVIANLPEGRRTADALAGRLKGRVVVFENFPALDQGRVSFDAMLRSNLDALLKSSRP